MTEIMQEEGLLSAYLLLGAVFRSGAVGLMAVQINGPAICGLTPGTFSGLTLCGTLLHGHICCPSAGWLLQVSWPACSTQHAQHCFSPQPEVVALRRDLHASRPLASVRC